MTRNKTHVAMSERSKSTLISLLNDINQSYSGWGTDYKGSPRNGVEFEVTPRQIGFAKRLLKQLK